MTDLSYLPILFFDLKKKMFAQKNKKKRLQYNKAFGTFPYIFYQQIFNTILGQEQRGSVIFD